MYTEIPFADIPHVDVRLILSNLIAMQHGTWESRIIYQPANKGYTTDRGHAQIPPCHIPIPICLCWILFQIKASSRWCTDTGLRIFRYLTSSLKTTSIEYVTMINNKHSQQISIRSPPLFVYATVIHPAYPLKLSGEHHKTYSASNLSILILPFTDAACLKKLQGTKANHRITAL